MPSQTLVEVMALASASAATGEPIDYFRDGEAKARGISDGQRQLDLSYSSELLPTSASATTTIKCAIIPIHTTKLQTLLP
jgi:hypothetical protein